MDRLVNTTFICTVTNAVGTGRAEQVVLVRGERVLEVIGSPGVPPFGVRGGPRWGEAVPPAWGGIQTRLADEKGGQRGSSLLPPGGIWIGMTG